MVSQISADAGEDDKFDKLKELIEKKEKGLIDDDEFKQMMMVEIMDTESKEKGVNTDELEKILKKAEEGVKK